MKKRSSYPGHERRRRSVYVTQNTEYHFRDEVCVAVRQRSTGQWRLGHAALQRKLGGGISVGHDGYAQLKVGTPAIGDALFFADGGADVVTSALLAVQRPSARVVAAYPI